MQPHWMHIDDRTSVRRGQIGGLKGEWLWCEQPVDWVSLPGGHWTVVTIPPNIPAKRGDQVQIERVGDTWMVTLILRTDTPATTTTTTTNGG